jgi:hypothetical protein
MSFIFFYQDLVTYLRNIAYQYNIINDEQNTALDLEIKKKDSEKLYYLETEDYLKTLTVNELKEILNQKQD